jgi:hypothetical protein
MLVAIVFFAAGGAAAQEEKLGKVRFKTSCTAAAQKEFDRALALLHSFAFPETVKAFSAIPGTDPKCAIAYWGIAASLRPDPLVGPWSAEAQQRALDAVAQGEAAGAKTGREKDWLAAIKVLYRDFASVDQETRSRRYEQAMAALARKYSDDIEARVFHALALIEVFDGKEEKPLTQAVKSLQTLGRRYSEHPGVFNYLIRGMELGPATKKALPFATRYARIAPAAPHAHQMPSHIYSMLGMWKEVVATNLAAVRVAAEFAERNRVEGVIADVARAYDALVYAHLQLGQDAGALAALKASAKLANLLEPLAAAEAARAAAAARYALERQDWKTAAKLEMHEGYAVAATVTRFARALGAARSGDLTAARAEVDKLRAIRAEFDGRHQAYWTEQTETAILAAQAWVAQAQGSRREAHKLMRAAADLEDSIARNILLENRVYPLRELLADLLRVQGDPGAALTEYDAVPKTAPNRLRAYYGAAKSAEAIGEKKKAAAYFAQLAKLTQDADGDRPELVELKGKIP